MPQGKLIEQRDLEARIENASKSLQQVQSANDHIIYVIHEGDAYYSIDSWLDRLRYAKSIEQVDEYCRQGDTTTYVTQVTHGSNLVVVNFLERKDTLSGPQISETFYYDPEFLESRNAAVAVRYFVGDNVIYTRDIGQVGKFGRLIGRILSHF